ncbi:MAG: hypothetical protein AAF417_23210, partial [Pseudomonadota bacterium]
FIDATGLAPDTLTTGRGENGTELWAGYFVLKPGQQQQVTFTYTLPPRIQPDDYQLLVRRQSGTKPLNLTLAMDEEQSDLLIEGGELLWSTGSTAR